MDAVNTQTIIVFIFGTTFVVALLVIAFVYPNPTGFQYNVFRVVLSLAAAGVAAMIPGFINLELNRSSEIVIRAGGALAVFIIIYFFSPAKLALHAENYNQIAKRIPQMPEQLPSGVSFPKDKLAVFNEIWQSLLSLESTAEALWREVSNENLLDFAHELREAKNCISGNALFFSDKDYLTLNKLLHAANFYLDGKARLSDIYGRQAVSDRIINLDSELEEGIEEKIRHQIQQNQRWLTRYKNLLAEIRSSLYRKSQRVQ